MAFLDALAASDDDPRAFFNPPSASSRRITDETVLRPFTKHAELPRMLAGGGRVVDAGLGRNGARHALNGWRLLRRRLGGPHHMGGQQGGEADGFHERLLHFHVALKG